MGDLERFNAKHQREFQYTCTCGYVGWARWSDLKKEAGSTTRSCRSCAMKFRMLEEVKSSVWAAQHKHMVARAKEARIK